MAELKQAQIDVADPIKREILGTTAKTGLLVALGLFLNSASINSSRELPFIPSLLNEKYSVAQDELERIFNDKVKRNTFEYEYSYQEAGETKNLQSQEEVFEYKSDNFDTAEDEVLNLVVYTGFNSDSKSFWFSGFDYPSFINQFANKLGKDVRLITVGMSKEIPDPTNYQGPAEDLFESAGKIYRHWTAPSLADFPNQFIEKVINPRSRKSKLLISGYSAGTMPAMKTAISLVDSQDKDRILAVQLGAIAPGMFIPVTYKEQLKALAGKRMRKSIVSSKYQYEWPILEDFGNKVANNGINTLVSHGTNDTIPSVSLLCQYAQDSWRGPKTSHLSIPGADHSNMPDILIFEGAPGIFLTDNNQLTSAFKRRGLLKQLAN